MRKTWMVTIDADRHIVELDFGRWSGNRKIYVNRELVLSEKARGVGDEEYRFKVVGKDAFIEVICGIVSSRFALYVDGKRV